MGQEKFLTLPPLPGGSKSYIESMGRMLGFLAGDIDRTREEFADWAINVFPVSQSSIDGYIQTLERLGLIESKAHQRLRLTQNGNQFIKFTNFEAKAKIVLSQLLSSYVGTMEILAFIGEAQTSVSIEHIIEAIVTQYSAWQNSDHVARRIYWLEALGCVHQISYRRQFTITAFGREIINKFLPASQLRIGNKSAEETLIQRLCWAARYTEDSNQFEIVMQDVCEFLGYKSERLGGTGRTDLVNRALLGLESYSFIADTKSRRDGKLDSIDVLTLKSHQADEKADYVVVVAEEFVGDRIKRFALENHIILLTIDCIIDWIRLHHKTPLNLLVYRHLFERVGLVAELPKEIKVQSAKQVRFFQLVDRLINLFLRAYEINPNINWSSSQLYTSLSMEHSERYTLEEVDHAIAFLANPGIGAIIISANGLILGVNRKNLALLFEQVARKYESEA